MKTSDDAHLEIIEWDLLDYRSALDIQMDMVRERLEDKSMDRLLLLSHPAVITMGKNSSPQDLCVSEKEMSDRGIDVCRTDRGGKVTFHGPGQLVAYPIIKLRQKDIHQYVHTLLNVIASVLVDFNLSPEFKEGVPGVWVNGGKIASIGLSVKNWVTYHGIALNVNTDISQFNLIVPCGMPGQPVTSMERELGCAIDFPSVKKSFVHHFRNAFGYYEKPLNSHPDWLKLPVRKPNEIQFVHDLIRELNLETVCSRAKCPNLGECFSNGTATFMILGKHCTRACRFCAVEKGKPEIPDPTEPMRVALAIKKLKLKYAVITSVTRDDLPDGGADQFVRTMNRIREVCPETKVEILVPDFAGNNEALGHVLRAKPDMFNHNTETIPRLYPLVRPGADYQRSLGLLKQAAGLGLSVKSGLMLGFGETEHEIKAVLDDLLRAGCRHLTMGQYLSPSKSHIPIKRHIPPKEFENWNAYAQSAGFRQVVAGPLVRSSYRAEAAFIRFDQNFENMRAG